MDDQTRPIETPVPDQAVPDQAAGAMSPAVPAAGPAPGSTRTRWIVGLGVAGLAIALAIGALFLFGAATSPEALRYVPGDAAFVAEVRMDLPGDQMQALGNLLAHFPGFQDQSTMGDKIDEAFSRLIAAASEGEADYLADVKPWLNGPAFIGVLAPAAGATGAAPTGAVVSATTNGAVACDLTFDGQSVTHEPYRNLDLVLSADGSMACVIDGRQALIGDPATVRKALDAKAGGTGMDRSDEYKAARTTLGGDRLATMFVRGSSLHELMPTASDAVGIPGLDALSGALPPWMIVGIRAENDALVVDTVAAPVAAPSAGPSMLALPATHASLIAGAVPADTMFLLEDQGTGVTLQNLLATLESMPELGAPLQVLDGLGGSTELVGWIDDVGVAVSVQGTTPEVAVLLVARNEAAASERVIALGTVLGLAGLGGGIDVSQSTLSGVAVTTVTITDLGSVVPPGTVPGVDEIPATGPISFSIAARGRFLLVTSGEVAMKNLLDVRAGSSLADQADFKQARQRALPNSRTTVYVAANAALDAVKGFLPAETLAQFETDYAPYLDPIQAISLSVSSDAAASRSRFVFTVAQP